MAVDVTGVRDIGIQGIPDLRPFGVRAQGHVDRGVIEAANRADLHVCHHAQVALHIGLAGRGRRHVLPGVVAVGPSSIRHIRQLASKHDAVDQGPIGIRQAQFLAFGRQIKSCMESRDLRVAVGPNQ